MAWNEEELTPPSQHTNEAGGGQCPRDRTCRHSVGSLETIPPPHHLLSILHNLTDLASEILSINLLWRKPDFFSLIILLIPNWSLAFSKYFLINMFLNHHFLIIPCPIIKSEFFCALFCFKKKKKKSMIISLYCKKPSAWISIPDIFWQTFRTVKHASICN